MKSKESQKYKRLKQKINAREIGSLGNFPFYKLKDLTQPQRIKIFKLLAKRGDLQYVNLDQHSRRDDRPFTEADFLAIKNMLIANKSIRSISFGYHENNDRYCDEANGLLDVLADSLLVNPSATSLQLYLPFTEQALDKLTENLASHHSLCSLQLYNTGNSKINSGLNDKITGILRNLPNLMSYRANINPHEPILLKQYCTTNEEKARNLIIQIQDNTLVSRDLKDCCIRLPSIANLFHNESMYREEFESSHECDQHLQQLLTPIVKRMVVHGYPPPKLTGLDFSIDILVNFSEIGTKEQLLHQDDKLGCSLFFQSIASGQLEELITWHIDHKMPLLAEDFLRGELSITTKLTDTTYMEQFLKSLSILATRHPQQLVLLFNLELWQGRPIELNQLASYIKGWFPELFEKQIGETAYKDLIEELNLSCMISAQPQGEEKAIPSWVQMVQNPDQHKPNSERGRKHGALLTTVPPPAIWDGSRA